MIFTGIDIYTGKYTAIRTGGGMIAEISLPDRPPQADKAPVLSRGFTDIQVNGFRGVDYSGEGLREESILQLINDLARAGTLRHLPTLITGSFERTRENLAIISRAVDHHPLIRACIAGIHLEGPYISKEDGARGAHDLRYVRDPAIEELRAWQEAANGLIRLVTLAPERDGAIPFIREAVGMGITAAIGHSLASEEQIHQAADAGASLSTHLGNGSPALLPRLKNPVWAQLADDRLHASVIADGFHIPQSTLKVFARAKGLDHIILVSDIGPMGGLAAGAYRWGNTNVEVFPDGHLGLAGTEYLAGAGHLLDRCIMVFRKACGCTLRRAVSLATQSPVSFLKLAGGTGGFRVGEPADIICFEEAADRLNVLSCALGPHEWLNGQDGGHAGA